MVRKLPLVLAASLGILAVGAAAKNSSTQRPDVSAMSMKDIHLHNERLTSTDPYFISCKRFTVPGSLAKKGRICLTKEDWRSRAEKAQDWAHDVMDKSRLCCRSG